MITKLLIRAFLNKIKKALLSVWRGVLWVFNKKNIEPALVIFLSILFLFCVWCVVSRSINLNSDTEAKTVPRKIRTVEKFLIDKSGRRVYRAVTPKRLVTKDDILKGRII